MKPVQHPMAYLWQTLKGYMSPEELQQVKTDYAAHARYYNAAQRVIDRRKSLRRWQALLPGHPQPARMQHKIYRDRAYIDRWVDQYPEFADNDPWRQPEPPPPQD